MKKPVSPHEIAPRDRDHKILLRGGRLTPNDKEIAEFAKAFFLICMDMGHNDIGVRRDKFSRTLKVKADDYNGGVTFEFICDKGIGAYRAARHLYDLITKKDKK